MPVRGGGDVVKCEEVGGGGEGGGGGGRGEWCIM